MNILLTSHTRTGSSWLCKLLLEITGYQHSKHYGKLKVKNTNPGEGNNLLRKSHMGSCKEVFHRFEPINYKNISILRNPRDRYLSVCKHRKINPDKNVHVYKTQERQQVKRMVRGHSTAGLERKYPYMWTAYEWLIDDTSGELRKILDFVGLVDIPAERILEGINHWDNRNVSGERDIKRFGHADIVITKNKWENNFSQRLIEQTQPEYNTYMRKLKEG